MVEHIFLCLSLAFWTEAGGADTGVQWCTDEGSLCDERGFVRWMLMFLVEIIGKLLVSANGRDGPGDLEGEGVRMEERKKGILLYTPLRTASSSFCGCPGVFVECRGPWCVAY